MMLRRFSVKTFYEVLGIQRSADAGQVKSAYYQLAKKYHPDQDPGNAELFKAISEAYETLKDDQKRYDYDLQQGFLNAIDIDRMEDLEKRFGSKYGKIDTASSELWEQVKQFDDHLTKQYKDAPTMIKKGLIDGIKASLDLKLSGTE
mmetsp:Transcript_7095/g.12979  ORF Transcript_7095/g.12979 Transcript_7095/m.12979 type:complete len:147 (-) Transcript_7095:188-628(-)